MNYPTFPLSDSQISQNLLHLHNSQKKFSILCAIDNCFGISKNGAIPWHSKYDLQFFKELTSQASTHPNNNNKNAILMGRKTWDSLPQKPLPNRYNLILTSNIAFFTPPSQDITLFFNWKQALSWSTKYANHLFIIGGAQIYEIALLDPRLSHLYLTFIESDFNCDLFFPWNPHKFTLEKVIHSWKEDSIKYSIRKYIPKSL